MALYAARSYYLVNYYKSQASSSGKPNAQTKSWWRR
jgi:hypothetical protein